ncbi:thiamine pyrophosphate-binding protein [Polycladidibacter hongkongensis]|uniref:thiamine pyrophosphate-binding protein n=1 Tax=Polycladidibacter hongkongensis TaxID=1647556 RepID=UPI000833D66D|nr:thiamine pyrophosphate-binding protein [Pseudovibrio hongkongensis]
MQEQQQAAGHLIVEALAAQGAERVFCVPGESYLPVLDGLHDASIPVTVCRQEGGAAMMAEAHGKLTGRPGICMVTRGPGATNAAAGVHVAQQDRTPMILFVGQIDSQMRERDAFQEVDYRQMFGKMAKWVAEIDHASRIPEFIARAYRIAMSGNPGPVVLALPEDMLQQSASPKPVVRVEPVAAALSNLQQAELEAKLSAAKRPLAIVGGARWSAAAVASLQKSAEKLNLPVACGFRRQMLFDHTHPCYAGDVGIGINPALRAAIEAADLLLVIGEELSEMPSQSYELLDIPVPEQQLLHVLPDPLALGRLYQPDLAICADPASFCAALETIAQSLETNWQEWRDARRTDYEAWSGARPQIPGSLQMREVMEVIACHAPTDTIITNGAGNYATWVHRFHRFRSFGSQLAPTSGSMGYGLPAAIAAKLQHPDRQVLCFAGDGCLQMTIQELATAAQEQANIIVIAVDNGMYGTIRMHQERTYPGRVSATTLQNPDFGSIATAYGFAAHRVETAAQFEGALKTALAHNRPSFLHLLLDPEAITPAASLSQIRTAAQQKNP